MNQEELKKALRILKTKKITQTMVAKELGMSVAYLSHVVNGVKPISQNFEDIFMVKFGAHLTGVALREFSPEKVLVELEAIRAENQTLKKIIVNLFETRFTSRQNLPADEWLSEIVKHPMNEKVIEALENEIEAAALRNMQE
ncbi:helix-turn-helix domain-containing protein [Chitinophaga varians]|uniref:helix-turn-helix domain-containing protein n=1 Tax=Chitinophaga varians TaxID=2202339 RepID=UPI00165F1B43|nr:helix-turn-helix transcriptional regulator [Chitinophaga varians]MBC9913164.1 helix-turn-helix transcriptional regulator [Chitinophaga varians]